jgi:F0F1-type ATP synthase membrane subunit c/vacuolar-type H+-ATPase subunit K
MKIRAVGAVAVGRMIRVADYGRDPRARIALAALAFAAVGVVTILIAYPRMFNGFAVYDDEGYMLTALKSFVNHGALYDDVFTQYGPFYYEAWGGVFSLFGIPINPDSGRMATLVAWVLTSLTLGLATWRMTGSIVLGLVVQMVVAAALGAVASNEPMHPGGIICLLLAAIVAISCAVRVRTSPGAMGLLGGAVAALVLVKINVGAFAVAAVVLACAVSYPALSRRRWLRLAIEVAFVLTPAVLLSAKLGESWARHYAAHVSMAALAVVIALRARDSGARETEELWWLGGGFLAAAVTILLAVVGSGTSIGGLVGGVIEQPLRQSDAFSLPFIQAGRIHTLDLIGLAGALTYWYVTRGRPSGIGSAGASAMSLLSILVGIALVLSPIGKGMPFDPTSLGGYQISLLGFAWLALISSPNANPVSGFARLLLPPLAVMQALHAYPVAGSQTIWAAFLLIPVGALCVANGVRGLSATLEEGRERNAALALGVAVAIALTLFIADETLRRPLRDNRNAYEAAVPLGLPGAGSVRLGEPEAQQYREISAVIDRNCATFVTLPGMDSFYFWTDRQPPTRYNATGWPTLFDDDAQRRVIADTRSIPALCLLENIPIAEFWSQGEVPDGPLVRYLHRGFRPIVAFGDYRLLRREGAADS